MEKTHIRGRGCKSTNVGSRATDVMDLGRSPARDPVRVLYNSSLMSLLNHRRRRSTTLSCGTPRARLWQSATAADGPRRHPSATERRSDLLLMADAFHSGGRSIRSHAINVRMEQRGERRMKNVMSTLRGRQGISGTPPECLGYSVNIRKTLEHIS